MGSLLFWRWNPPDPEMSVATWRTFLDAMAGWLVVSVVVGVVVILAIYAVHAGVKRIREPADVFATYTPLAWLVLACGPAIVLFVAYWNEFSRSFPEARVSWMGGAVELAIIGGAATLVLSYFATYLPLVTPKKYRYRPRAVLFRWFYTRR